MLTPAQLREYEFKGAGRNAYKADEVDEFLATVVIDYEKMFRENAELIKRVGLLADRLEQMKKEEDDIKQAVLSAQRAADMIVKEAEESVTDAHSEADAILSAAKGEAQIIKSDAEKQAVADSELIVSAAKKKAAEILTKAKDEARTILIDAKDSAKDKVGAANRTVTSESLYFDMLKKEVSDFRASILAQYKAHIEMISKLPEAAAEKAKDLPEQPYVQDVILDAPAHQEDADSVLEFVDVQTDEAEPELPEFDEIEDETVVKTTLPFDFFGEDPGLEIISEDSDDEKKESGFTVDFSDINLTADDFDADFADEQTDSEEQYAAEGEAPLEFADNSDEEMNANDADSENNDSSDFVEPADIPISGGFKLEFDSLDGVEFAEDNTADDVTEEESDGAEGQLSFDSFEHIEANDDDVDDVVDGESDDDEDRDDDDKSEKSHFGFFRRKK